MKNDFDKELDSLLRGHTATVRRDAASALSQSPAGAASSPRDARASVPLAQSPSHLDADELNAYAENALPPATRSRYMAHLADCDSCRKIASDIALAAGVAVELEKRVAVPEHSAATVPTWRERLAALFAPRVLRYVAPALAVLLVGIVGFIALRQNSNSGAQWVLSPEERPNVAASRPDSDEAKQQPASPSSPAGTTPEEIAKTNPPPTVAPGVVGSASGGTAQPVVRPEILKDVSPPPPPPVDMAKKGGPLAAPATGDYAVNKNEENFSSANQQRDVGRVETQTTTAQNSVTINEDYSRGENSRAIQNNAEVNRADTGDYDSSRRSQRSEIQSRARTSPSADKSVEEAGIDDAAEASPPPPKPATARAGRQLGAGARKQNASKEKNDGREAEDERDAATRTVAGRRFRRQRGVWIDTAYSSPRALIDVRRGSEQFRALVADESGLRSIASQLGGEVIVVWKNRAYRIR